jgi:hypothetical protein
MDPKKGHAFSFATTLSALHFLTSAASLWVGHLVTGGPRPHLPWKGAPPHAAPPRRRRPARPAHLAPGP